MSKYIDISNKKYGKLTALKINHIQILASGQKREHWLCKCECGNETIVSKVNLLNNHTKSCGCLKHEAYNFSHKKKNTRIYNIWTNIKTRCYNKNRKNFYNYGGRGITVCDEWKKDFMSFYNWAMANGYNDTLTIDRIDVNGNYEPSNCRWVDIYTQANNKRTNHFLTYNGNTHTLAEWARIYNINYKLFQKKISQGKTMDYIISKYIKGEL